VIVSAPATPPVARASPAERAAQLRRISALGARRDAAALGELAATLSGHADPLVRARAAAALSRTRQPEAGRALEAALGDRDASVRAQVVRGLVSLAPERALETVGHLLATDPDARVRRAVAHNLGALQSERARAALQAATLDADASVRRAASAALARAARRIGGAR
jgi:HEAT repeat protein